MRDATPPCGRARSGRYPDFIAATGLTTGPGSRRRAVIVPPKGSQPNSARPISSCPAPRRPTRPSSSPCADIEGHRAGCRRRPDRAPRRRSRPACVGLCEELAGRTADDHLDQFVRLRLADRLLAHQLAVAQHGDAVGDAEDLVEPVRDIDHADAAFLQRTDRIEQPLDLVGRQAGGRLVEHQHVGFDGQRAGDGDQRFFGAGEVLHPRASDRSRSRPASAPRGPGLPCRRQSISRERSGKALRQADILADRHPFDRGRDPDG